MKRLNAIFVSILVVLAFSACDILDSQEPRQSLPLDQLYSSTEDLENALTGAYNDVQSGDAMGSSYPLFGELMGENTQWTGSFEQWQQIASHDIDLTNSQVEDVWNQTYEALNDINLIIEAVDAGEIDDDAFVQAKDRIKGEALFLRAMLHFEAVRMWAKPWDYTSDNSHAGVPVVTSGVQSADNFKTPERSDVATVYQRVITDLNDAISLLSNYSPSGSARANVINAQAYLARVYLQQGVFDEVVTLTEAVISSNQYSLEGAPQDYFFTPSEESSAESVFDVVHTDQDNPGVNNSLSTFYNGTNGGRGDISVTDAYTSALASATSDQAQNLPQGYSYEDLRSTELISPGGFTLKYEDGVNTADNAPVIRYADVLLMRAEALAETASTYPSVESNDAIDLLNEVHLRSIRAYNENGGSEDASQWFAYDETDFTSNAELLDAIYLERQVELGFEGKRKHDLVRWGMNVTSGTSGEVTAPDANNLIWPIPESELDANDSICQNAGYGGADTCE
jgi:hypothetical protein